MKAILQTRYGLRSLRIRDVPRPVPEENQVLVRVHAAALNYAVMYRVSGKPVLVRLMMGRLLKPKRWIPGGELSGRVEAIGAKVRAFKPGDEVYGDTCKCGYGALAELVCADESALAPKPAGLSFEEAAGVPQSALVALQGLRAGGIRKGQKVLVHGASGGIGTFATASSTTPRKASRRRRKPMTSSYRSAAPSRSATISARCVRAEPTSWPEAPFSDSC